MNRIWYVGIESLVERYSEQWNRWFPEAFKELGIPFSNIKAKPLVKKIETGKFLDVYSTNYYKAGQLKEIIRLLRNGQIKDGDTIFFCDLWFPGIEALAYIRQASGKRFLIKGVLHAGTYDPHDFLHQQGMEFWGCHLETCWLEFVDKVFVATKFHKKLIVKKRGVKYAHKIKVTGLPFKWQEVQRNQEKQNIIVFPHRLDPEKQPEKFETLSQKKISNWKFLKTKKECKNKEQYYQLLGKSKISISFALQETFGYAMLESLANKCFVLVPDRLSYKEMYPATFKYRSLKELERKIKKCSSEYPAAARRVLDRYTPNKVVRRMFLD